MSARRSNSLSTLSFGAALILILLSGCATASRSTNDGGRGIAAEAVATVDLSAILKECYSPDLGDEAEKGLKVNGHALSPGAAKNVRWISRCVVPYLPGSVDDQAEVAARAAWWSLREGILDLGVRAFRYANCHENGKDRIRSSMPMHDCPTNIWQVGIGAAQVMNYSRASVAESIARVQPSLDPHLDDDALLRWTATLAGFPAHSEEYSAIVKSTGRVRRSWLIRNPLLAFMLVAEQEVGRECLKDHRRWCTSGSYPAAVRFSHTRTGVLKSIADLKKIFLNRQVD